MLVYTLFYSLLLLVAWGGYRLFLSREEDSKVRKKVLKGLVVLALTLPIFIPLCKDQSLAFYTDNLPSNHLYDEWNVVDGEDFNLQACYKKAKDSRDFCTCELVQKSNIIRFEANKKYNIYSKIEYFGSSVLGILLCLYLLKLLYSLVTLYFLVQKSELEPCTIEGIHFFKLRPKNSNWRIASFSLWSHYVICPAIFDALTKEEQELVLQHELAHIKQGDTRFVLFLSIIGGLSFFSPVYYWIKKELTSLNEFVADEYAKAKTSGVKFYANTLLKVKGMETQKKSHIGVLHFADKLLTLRIKKLIGTTTQQQQRSWTTLYRARTLYLLFCMIAIGAFAFLSTDVNEFKEYKILKRAYEQTGERDFCKSCLLTDLLDK